MKKIIMYMCIISLTCGAATDVSAAPTLQEIVSSAAKATLEKAKAENSGIEFNSTTAITSETTSLAPLGSSGTSVMSTLSNMRAQAEVYYSNTGSYGPVTQSCSAGMFGNSSSGGLATLLSGVRKYSNEINCTVTAKGYAVSAKTGTGAYWCVDSSGYSVALSKILKKGSISCSSGTKPVPKVRKETSTITSILSLFPTVSGFDIKYALSIAERGTTESLTRILKQGMNYMLISKMMDSDLRSSTMGLYVGRYLAIPDKSYLAVFLGLPTTVEQSLNTLISNSSIRLVRTNADASSVYELSVPYSVYIDMSLKFITQMASVPSYGKSLTAPMKVQVTIKNGLITGVSASNTVVNSSNGKMTHTIKSRMLGGGLQEPQLGNVVSCVDYFDTEEEEVCEVFDMQAVAAEAREKGEAAAIKSYLSGMRAGAELYYSGNNNSYGPISRSCAEGIFATGYVGELMKDLRKKNPSYVFCGASNTEWAVSTSIPTGGYFCVDSTGTAKETSVRAEYGDLKCK